MAEITKRVAGLEKQRRAAGMSKTQLAFHTGMSRQRVSAIMLGPTETELDAMSAAIDAALREEGK